MTSHLSALFLCTLYMWFSKPLRMASGLPAAACALPPQLSAVCPAWILSVLSQGSCTLPLSCYLYLRIKKLRLLSLFLPCPRRVPSPNPSHSRTAPGVHWKIPISSTRIDPDGRLLGTEGLVTHASADLRGVGLGVCTAGEAPSVRPVLGCTHLLAAGWASPANCTREACRKLPLGIWQ